MREDCGFEDHVQDEYDLHDVRVRAVFNDDILQKIHICKYLNTRRWKY